MINWPVDELNNKDDRDCIYNKVKALISQFVNPSQ